MKNLLLILLCILMFSCEPMIREDEEYIPDLEITVSSFIDDRDGREYETITILGQTWMSENMAFLPSVSPSGSGSEDTPYYYVYDYEGNDVDIAKTTDNYQLFGVLYNWDAAVDACPDGWHLAGEDEWNTFSNNLISNRFGYAGAGDDIAKSMASNSVWNQSQILAAIGKDLTKNNTSHFSALPGGHLPPNGTFSELYYQAFFWTSTLSSNFSPIAYLRNLKYSDIKLFESWSSRQAAYSVRCVKD